MRARIGLPASGLMHLSPPPMRLDLPPASRMPATGWEASISESLQAGRGDLQARLWHARRFAVRSLDFHRAEFVFRNLADRIELRIGEDVGGRLHIGERDEHVAFLDAEIGAGGELDRASARGHPDILARLDAVAGKRARMETRGGAGLERIEHIGATGHGAGMPMLELTPGD